MSGKKSLFKLNEANIFGPKHLSSQHGIKTNITPSNLIFPNFSHVKGRQNVSIKQNFVSKIHSQINLIREEVLKMHKCMALSCDVSINNSELTKTAKETASRFAEYQHMLCVYNNLIDFNLNNNSCQDYFEEIDKLKERSKHIQEEINHLEHLIYRRKCIVKKISEQLDNLHKNENKLTNLLNEKDHEKYEFLSSKNEDYLNKIIEERKLINNEQKIIERLKNKLNENVLKCKKYELLQIYSNHIQHLQILQEELKNIDSAEEQKLRLKEKLQKSRIDTEKLIETRDQLKNEINAKIDEIRVLDNEPQKDSAKIEKFQRMKCREKIILNYLNEYPVKRKELIEKINNENQNITKLLENIEKNIKSKLDNNDLQIIEKYATDEQSVTQLDSLRKLENHLQEIHQDESTYKNKIVEVERKIDFFSKTDQKFNDSDNSKQKILQAKLEMIKVDVECEEKELSYLEDKLSRNECYNSFLSIQKRLQVVNNEIENITNDLKKTKYSQVIENKMREVCDTIAKYNVIRQKNHKTFASFI